MFKWHKSQVLLIFLISFLTGTVLGQLVNPQLTRVLFFLIAIASVIVSTLMWEDKRYLLVFTAMIMVVFGVWHFQNSRYIQGDDVIAQFNGQGKLGWMGVVVEEPDVRDDKINLTVSAKQLIEPFSKAISGKVLVSVGRYPEYHYGDMLRITGKLETPFESSEFSYKNYLATDQIYSISRFAQATKLASGQGSMVKSLLIGAKSYFATKLSKIVPEPQNSLLLGLLVGARRSIPQEVLDWFKITGVTHIIAISGFNISIITRLLGGFIQKHLGIRASLVISILVVMGFVVITGAQASVVRAAIMGSLVVVGLNLGRVSSALNALFLAAGVMVFLQPSIVLFDVGFQLSFLATAGLILFADFFEKLFSKIPKAFEIRSTLAATLSAQIFVLPLLLFHFDQLSLISPISNLLILPIIPWTMFFGFISGVLGLVWLPLSYLTAWIAWLFLSWQINVVKWLAQVPYASINVELFPLSWVLIYYAILVLGTFILRVRLQNQRLARFRQ